MKLFVAVPAYDRRITCETARALLTEQSAAAQLGVEMVIGFVPGCCYIHTARDNLTRDFLRGDFDRMVMIDSDVGWEVGSLIKVAHHKPDFVAGAYRFKRDVEGYPVGWLDRPELYADPETGLLEVAAVPGGFLSLSRNVFDRLREAGIGRPYEHEGQQFYGYFHCPYGAGEDGSFCEDWRSIGGQVWLDPELTLTHVDGGASYTGHIGNWLRNRQ